MTGNVNDIYDSRVSIIGSGHVWYMYLIVSIPDIILLPILKCEF